MRAYNLLLRFYPKSFRYEYGDEMRAVFARRRRDAAGPLSSMALWLGTIPEVLGNAFLVQLDLLDQDLRYTLRIFWRAPGFPVTAVLIVALGIGATTAAFSVADFVLIRPLPFPGPERLVRVWQRTPDYSRFELSPANFRDWKAASTVFERLGMYHLISANMLGADEPMRVDGAAVSADLLPTLGVQPLIGRTFVDQDDRPEAGGTAILSYRLWRTRFGGDQGVIGRQLSLDGTSYTVIGVMPREFRFPMPDTQL